jgi:hypothetical protein
VPTGILLLRWSASGSFQKYDAPKKDSNHARPVPIRAKITAVVAFLLIAMTGMGLLAVRNMRAINANTVDVA